MKFLHRGGGCTVLRGTYTKSFGRTLHALVTIPVSLSNFFFFFYFQNRLRTKRVNKRENKQGGVI